MAKRRKLSKSQIKKRKKEYYNKRLEEKKRIINLILKNSHLLGYPNINITKYNLKVDVPTEAWFNINKFFYLGKEIKGKFEKLPINDTVIKANKYPLYLSESQKEIVLKWMHAAEIMYNITLKYAKHIFHYKYILSNKYKLKMNYMTIRTKILKGITNIISKKYDTPIHILDEAIKRLCTSWNACVTNLVKKRIKKFNLRYLKHSKPIKTITIQKDDFSVTNNTFFPRKLGKNIDSNGVSLIKKDITSDCTLQYNKHKNRFTLFMTSEVKTIKNNNKEIISIDPGVRTFLTGISNNNVTEIGTNVSDKIKTYLMKTDSIKNRNLPDKIKKKHEYRNNKKIKNSITDLHWKSIKYLTDNFKTICIGKWSTKSIGLNETSVLTTMTKRIASRLRFYEYLQKLQYKCNLNQTNLYITDESYTSKLCSNCGWENVNLGSSKIFNCKNCLLTIDRDINGARNIFIKSLK